MRRFLRRVGMVACALVGLSPLFFAIGGDAQVPPALVVPRACDVTTVTTGGTAVNAFSGPVNGYYIVNPLTLADEGIVAAEPLLLNPAGAATAAANGTTEALPPGAIFAGIAGSTGPVSINAVTSGHKFTCVRW